MVIKPAASSGRRPSCPSLRLNGVQNKFQTFSHASMATPTARPAIPPSFNAQSTDSDHHNQAPFTLGRPIPKFQIEPPTPAVGGYGDQEQEGRWRFESRDSEGNDDGQQCPPALPSRVTRNASSVERREHFNVANRYRNSLEDSSTKSTWRDSDFLDEDSEDYRDPDYDLPKLNYDGCEDLNRAAEADALQSEVSEDDRDDDYSYPQFHYTLEAPPEGQLFRNSLSVVEETEGTFESSYDYLPGYSGSKRTSTCRSSTQMSGSDNPLFDDRGIYDILPKRNSSLTEGTGSRMSGIEPGLDDSGCVYQNDVFCRSPTDIYDHPQQQNPTQFPDASNGAEYANGVLPPLPEKKALGHKEVVEKRRVAPLPPPSVSDSDEHKYMNAGDVRMSNYSSSSSQDEGVYLSMACGKPVDTIYTPMHSPDSGVAKPIPSESNCNRSSEEEARGSMDVREPSLAQNNQSSGK